MANKVGRTAMISLEARCISKHFGKRQIVRDLDAVVRSGECLGIAGANGSGKSTVLKMLGSLLRPDTGSVILTINDVVSANPLASTGLVAPWLAIYEEFTIRESLALLYQLHGETPIVNEIDSTLQRLDLASRADDYVKELSSGLRQRVLLALATLRKPAILLLDEPSITLDAQGKSLVRSEIERHRLSGGVVILATNDSEELSWSTSSISLTTLAVGIQG